MSPNGLKSGASLSRRLPRLEDEEGPNRHKGEPDQVVPLQGFAQISHREEDENGERNDFLRRFQLSGGKTGLGAPTIGGDLKTVLKERDSPTRQDHDPQG